MKHVAMLSGGQDSTAMTLRLLELGEPVDLIVFSDTTLEFPEMYEYIDKLDAFIKRRYGMSITKTKPNKSFEEWVFGKITRGENKGLIRGTPRVALPCFWRREAKEYPIDRLLKELGFDDVVKYVGYTSTERERATGMEEYNYRAPLIEWGWDEQDVKKYLRELNVENKLYQHFSRTGCAVCPKQSLDDKYQVWLNYPDTWRYMVDMEERLVEEKRKLGQPVHPAWHSKLMCSDMELLFERKKKQKTFDFGEEQIHDCFCEI